MLLYAEQKTYIIPNKIVMPDFSSCTFSSFCSAMLLLPFPLIVGWCLDLIFGDPACLPHPVVYMGKWIAFGERRLNKGKCRRLKGAVFAVASILLVLGITGAFFAFLQQLQAPGSSILLILVESVMVFFCLAGRTLRSEVRMVFEAVDRSVEEGRTQVARIVGRDTSELTAQEIRTAALETLAENLSDGVIAPLFWFLLLGVPGMMTYKMVNTLDSMIGYHSERYKDFGCWAARIDDVFNLIPARLTALLMIIVAPLTGKCAVLRFSLFTLHFGPQHASPNSGWPEAALAGILDCRFGGPHNYFGEYFYKPYIGTNPRQLTTADMKKSVRLCFLAECLAVIFVLFFSFLD